MLWKAEKPPGIWRNFSFQESILNRSFLAEKGYLHIYNPQLGTLQEMYDPVVDLVDF